MSPSALLLALAMTLTTAEPVPLAVLGDSDSHSYQDRIGLPEGNGVRGGVHRDTTLQWTEVLAREHADRVDLGPWGEWHEIDGIARLPRKQDFRHNFAWSGARCDDLLRGEGRQLEPLLQTIALDPQRWRRGVVVIRIGINDLGTADMLEAMAQEPDAAKITRATTHCVEAIARATHALQRAQPALRIVLVGLFNNAHWPPHHDRFRSPDELARIDRAIDRFDIGLRALAAEAGTVDVFDDRAWFNGHWGGRDGEGRPAYRTVRHKGLRVTNTGGDEPTNAVVADGHAGTVWNRLWAGALLEMLEPDGEPGHP